MVDRDGRAVSEDGLNREEMEAAIDRPHHYTPAELRYDDFRRFVRGTDESEDEDRVNSSSNNEDHDIAAGHTQDAHHGICLWTGRINKHTQQRLSGVLNKPFFDNERNQQKAIKLVRSICGILAKATAAAWTKRCKLWKDPKRVVVDTTITVDREATVIEKVSRRRGRQGLGKVHYRDSRLKLTQTSMSNFVVNFPPVRQLTPEEQRMEDSRTRKDQLKAEEEIERKRKAKEANMKCNQKRKSGVELRPKKSNKIKASVGTKSVEKHLSAAAGTALTALEAIMIPLASRTSAPESAPTVKASANSNNETMKEQTKTTASETKTAQEKPTSMTTTNQPAAKDISRTLSNNSNNSNNIACAHPPTGKTRSDREVVDMENRKGVG